MFGFENTGFFSKKGWDDFDVLPDVEEFDMPMELPQMNPDIYKALLEIGDCFDKDRIIILAARFMKDTIWSADKHGYTIVHLESMFRFVSQMARFNGVDLLEACKKDELIRLFYHYCYDMVSFEENSPAKEFSELSLILDAVADREKVIQKFSAGCFDYNTGRLFAAKLFKDPRLKGYFLNALRFYETVPREELLMDRETDLENIIDALGNPGWDEFVPIVAKYLKSHDKVLRYNAISSLGRIGGEKAAQVLMDFRREVLEGLVKFDEYETQCIDLYIIMAKTGSKGVMREVTLNDEPIIKCRIAIRMLSGLKDPRVIKFLFRLLDDERYEEAEVHYVSEQESIVRQEIRFSVREEAIMALESYEEDYVTSIVGRRYIYRRDYFYHDLDALYQKKGLKKYWDED